MFDGFGVGDMIAIYAAVLSTAVAILQYRQHQHSRRTLSIKFNDEFTVTHKSICCTITNLTNHTIHIECGGVGYTWKPWARPWAREFELMCKRPFVLGAAEQPYEETYVDSIPSGGAVHLECHDVQKHTPRIGWLSGRGFAGRNVVAIDHSASSKHTIAFP
jgi:hypothetical protein